MTRVKLDLPMVPDAELEASKTAMKLAESIQMSPDRIDEVGGAVVEACINAIMYSHSEKVFVTIEVLGDQDPEKLRITVQDTGVGFSPENPAKRPGGGFGLEIIRGLMDEVEIHSVLGEGTTVVMSKMR
ncbi:MAG TPA: ATP-binding protein [Thermoanaerobaculia bacterium]|nr:ATP-binding protein [Thermoanaerobaculia bacterium]